MFPSLSCQIAQKSPLVVIKIFQSTQIRAAVCVSGFGLVCAAVGALSSLVHCNSSNVQSGALRMPSLY